MDEEIEKRKRKAEDKVKWEGKSPHPFLCPPYLPRPIRRFLTSLTGSRARRRFAGPRAHARRPLSCFPASPHAEHYADTCRRSRRTSWRMEGVQRQDQDEKAKEDAYPRVNERLARFRFLIPLPHADAPGSTCPAMVDMGILCIASSFFTLHHVHGISFHATFHVILAPHLLRPRPMTSPLSRIITACCQLTNQLQPFPPLRSRTGYLSRPKRVGLPAKTCRWICGTLEAGEMWNPILRAAGTSSNARSLMSYTYYVSCRVGCEPKDLRMGR